MDINSSGTGGAEDDIMKIRKAEKEAANDANMRTNQVKANQGLKVGVTSGGPANTKPDELKNSGDVTAQGTPSKETDKLGKDGQQIDENGKRIRYDSFGNRITTTIGTFSVANRKNLIKNRKTAMSATSDTGGAETPLKKEEKK